MPGGYEAIQLRVAEQYITTFGELATAMNVISRQQRTDGNGTAPPAAR